jgi:uncharacterized protein (DUF983 family)
MHRSVLPSVTRDRAAAGGLSRRYIVTMHTSSTPAGGALRRAATLGWRALRLRCPNCGEGKAFVSWLRMRDRCPVCGLGFQRGEEGYAVGAYMFNMIASELVFAAAFVVAIVATWPSPPWEALTWVAAIGMVVAPILFYPVTKTLFLAFDLFFRPATPEELG